MYLLNIYRKIRPHCRQNMATHRDVGA
ncbi:hypothetical protein PSAC2689_10592 [Paraburkholderia sacchari]